MEIGFIGLGRMGTAIARNLLAAGHTLRLWNRTTTKAQALVAENVGTAIICETPREATTGADIVFSILSDDATLEQVIIEDDGILNGLSAGAIHLSLSTIGPDTARRMAQLHDLHDAVYLAAPVYGRPDVAAAATLHILLSGGDSIARERVRPILEVLGQKIWDFGDDPSAANVVKVCGNFMIGAAIAAMGEAFTLAERAGVDRQAIYEMLTGSVFACRVYQSYGGLIASEVYAPAGFTVPLGLKDVMLAQSLANATDTPLPLGGIVHDRLIAAQAKDRGHLDWSVLARESSESAGIVRKSLEE